MHTKNKKPNICQIGGSFDSINFLRHLPIFAEFSNSELEKWNLDIEAEIALREKRIRGRAKQPTGNAKDKFRANVHRSNMAMDQLVGSLK